MAQHRPAGSYRTWQGLAGCNGTLLGAVSTPEDSAGQPTWFGHLHAAQHSTTPHSGLDGGHTSDAWAHFAWAPGSTRGMGTWSQAGWRGNDDRPRDAREVPKVPKPWMFHLGGAPKRRKPSTTSRAATICSFYTTPWRRRPRPGWPKVCTSSVQGGQAGHTSMQHCALQGLAGAIRAWQGMA